MFQVCRCWAMEDALMCTYGLHLKFVCGDRWKFWVGHISPQLVGVEVRIRVIAKMDGSDKKTFYMM